MARPRRVPELRPALYGGRALPAVRTMRVRVREDGAVLHTDASGRERQLVAPGEVARALFVDHVAARRLVRGEVFRSELLILLDRGGMPLLALRLIEWCPPAMSSGAPWREVTGVPAVAAALDLPLEPAEPSDLAALDARRRTLRRVLVRPLPRGPWPGRWGAAVSSLALFLWVFSVTEFGDPTGAFFTLASLLVTGPLIVAGWRARAQARAAGPTPGRDARTVVRPRPVEPAVRGLTEATLELSAEDVVLTDRGREVWLPGPERGGVGRAVISPEVIQLTDVAGNEYATLATSLWGPADDARADLASRLREVGVEVLDVPMAAQTVATVADPHGAHIPPSVLLMASERGDATESTPWLSGLSAAVLVLSSAIATAWDVVGGSVLLAATGILLCLRLSDMARRSRADRRALRLVDPAQDVVPR